MKSIKEISSTAIKRFFEECFWLFFGISFLVLGIYFVFEDDQSYCLDTGFRAGDPMCQADENNKLVIVKE